MAANRQRKRRREPLAPPPAKLRRTQGDRELVPLALHKESKRSGEGDTEERATLQHRDEIVAAILTISSALGLARETLHVCVDVFDRFLDRRHVVAARLEMLGIAYVLSMHCGYTCWTKVKLRLSRQSASYSIDVTSSRSHAGVCGSQSSSSRRQRRSWTSRSRRCCSSGATRATYVATSVSHPLCNLYGTGHVERAD